MLLWKLQCWYILWTCPSGVSYWTLRGVLSLPSALNAECLSSILTHNSCEALRLCTLCSLVAFFTLLRRRCWQVKDKRMFVCLWAGRHITWRGGRSIFTDYSAVWYLTVSADYVSHVEFLFTERLLSRTARGKLLRTGGPLKETRCLSGWRRVAGCIQPMQTVDDLRH